MPETSVKPGLGCKLAKLLAGVETNPGISVLDGINTAAHTARGAVLLMAIVFGLLALVPPLAMRVLGRHRNQSVQPVVSPLADMTPVSQPAPHAKTPEGTAGLVQVSGTDIKSTFNEDTVVTDKRDAILLSKDSSAQLAAPAQPVGKSGRRSGRRASAAESSVPAESALPSAGGTAPLLRDSDAPPDDVVITTFTPAAAPISASGQDSLDMLLSASSVPAAAIPVADTQAVAAPEGFSLSAEVSSATGTAESAQSEKISYRKAPPPPQESPWLNNWIRLSIVLAIPVILVLAGARLRRSRPVTADILVRVSMVFAFGLVMAAPVVALRTGWRQGLFCLTLGAAESWFCRLYLISRFGWIPYQLMDILRNKIVRRTLEGMEQVINFADAVATGKPSFPPKPPAPGPRP